jgi:hypothetical protein
MGWRDFSDDAQRLTFWLTVAGGVVTAAAAGTYWNAWSHAWNQPAPVRGLLVLLAVVLAFVLWYLVAFTGYRYFGFPKNNPVVRSRRESAVAGLARAEAPPAELAKMSSPNTSAQPPTNPRAVRQPQQRPNKAVPRPLTFDPLRLFEAAASAREQFAAQEASRRLAEAARLDLPDSEVAIELQSVPIGLRVCATNLSAATLRDFALTLIDLRVWSEYASTFVETPQFHREGAFVPLEVNDERELFHRKPVTCPFITADREAPRLQGRLLEGFTASSGSLTEAGTWRATFSVRAGDRMRVQHLCFVWQPGHEPLPTGCPLERDVTGRIAAENVRQLGDLTEFAVRRLLNDPQKDDAWNLSRRVVAWEAQVLSALEAVGASQSDKSSFRVLGVYKSKNLQGNSPQHTKIRNELAERIDRLREITQRFEEPRRKP